MSNTTEGDKIGDRLQKWLLEDGYKIQSQPDKNTSFRIIATDNQGIKIQVLQPIAKPDQVVIAAGLNISEDRQHTLQSKDDKEQLRILWELRFGLLDLGVGFRQISMPLQNVEVSTLIYYDGLTKNAFMNEYSKVKRAVLFVFWTIDRELGEPKPKSNPEYVD